MQDLLLGLNIVVAKLAASTTAVAQALHAYKIFYSTKAVMKLTILMGEVKSRDILREQLKFMLNNHEKQTKHLGIFNKDDKKRLINALIKCRVVISKKLTTSLILNSF